jgi:hypothetical protein
MIDSEGDGDGDEEEEDSLVHRHIVIRNTSDTLASPLH